MLRKGIGGIVVANLSWIFGLIIFAVLLVMGSWKLGILLGLLAFVAFLGLGLYMIYSAGKKAVQNPDQVFDGLERAADKFGQRFDV